MELSNVKIVAKPGVNGCLAVFVDGQELQRVTSVEFFGAADAYAQVTIKLLANVEIEGEMVADLTPVSQ